MILSRFNALLALVAVASTAFFFIQSESLVADPTVKVMESKVEQASQGEETKTTTIKLQDKVWYGKIDTNETKHFELNLLFPDEGKFSIEIIGAAYNRIWKVWMTLGEYFVNVTTKKGEEGKIEKTTTRPKVTPYKIKAEGPITYNPWEQSKADTMKAKSSDLEIKSPPNPKPSWRLHQSMEAGEAPLEFAISFDPNPKINEPSKLLLSVSSTVARDSVCVELLIPPSIKVIK